MRKGLTALTGLHDPLYEYTIVDRLKEKGFDVRSARSAEEMLEIMEIQPDGFPLNNFHLYIMDINLGKSGGLTIEASRNVYKHVRPFVERGYAHFLAVSASEETVSLAQREGIPCTDKAEDKKVIQFIQNSLG